jgi:putative RNA 2'-phosphotransferase
MDRKQLVRISKQLSWMLRHQAEQLQLDVDPEGFVLIDDVVALLRRTVPEASEQLIRTIVETVEPQKQRFSIMDRHIRANYGHSLATPIAYQSERPPAILYHGTTINARPQILQEGLRPMKRQFVHLTVDLALARQIGARHGASCIMSVDAERAHDDGIVFHNANRGFWLVAALPPQYLGSVDG